MFVYTAKRIFILFVEVSQQQYVCSVQTSLTWSQIYQIQKKIVPILDNVPNLSHFPHNFNPCIFDSLSISICDSIMISKKSDKIGKENVKISQEKRQPNQTQNRKTSFFDRVLLCFRRGNCYVMSMSKVHTSLLLCWCSCVQCV